MEEAHFTSALRWITGLFEQYGVRYQITGGLAAKAYGSTRPLHDMDFDVESGAFDKLLPAVEKFVVFGPGEYEEADWSNFLLRLEYEGVTMNLSESSTRIFDRAKAVWTDWPVDFTSASRREIFGRAFPVINREQLIAYKKALNRPQDFLDREELERN